MLKTVYLFKVLQLAPQIQCTCIPILKNIYIVLLFTS